jgi:hypothetical protein
MTPSCKPDEYLMRIGYNKFEENSGIHLKSAIIRGLSTPSSGILTIELSMDDGLVLI